MNASAPVRDSLAAFFETHGRGKSVAFLVAMATCSVVGAVGNGVTLSVLLSRIRSAATSRFAFRNRYNYFTCALAASDLFVCTVWIPYEALLMMHVIMDEALCKATGFLSNAAIIFAAITHFGICVERYYAVRKPTSPVSARQMNIVIGGVAAISVAMSIPAAFTYSIYAYQLADDEETGCHYQYDSDIGLYYYAALGVLLSASIVTVLCLYSVLFREILKRMQQKRNRRSRAADAAQLGVALNSTEPSSESNHPKSDAEAQGSASAFARQTAFTATSRVAFMFFFVTLVFYATWLPFFLCALDVIERDIITENSHFVNSCANLILYSVFNAELRKEMFQKITCASRRKRISL